MTQNFCGILLLFPVIQWMLAGSSGFSKFSLTIWKFSVGILLKPDLQDLSILLLACEFVPRVSFTLLSFSYHASHDSTPIWPPMGVISTMSLLVGINSDFLFILLLLLTLFSRVWLCATPQTAAHQAPPSLGVSRQEHWSGLPFPSPMHESEKWKGSRSVVSDSSRPHGLQPTRLLHPWDFPGKKSIEVGCHCLLRLIYTTLH